MITTITPEMQTRQRTGFNYWTIPGKGDMFYGIETLDECIFRVFDISEIESKETVKRIGYHSGNVKERHLKRFILERLSRDGKITDKKRDGNKWYADDFFRFDMKQLSVCCNCDRTAILHSVRTTKNLIETNRIFREKAQRIFDKIELNLIKFPEL